ncbi:MAG TPA: PAC2 family protein, partial [Acidimicrobiia bacterium]
ERFGVLAGLSLDLAGIDQLADHWRVQVDRALAENDEVQTYITELEARIDAEEAEERGAVAGEPGIPSGNTLVDEVERYLREQRGQS